jgi:hypothetical protein
MSKKKKLPPDFWERLDSLLADIQDTEQSDFEDQLYEAAYVPHHITVEENDKLLLWVKGKNEDDIPREALAKCPHIYAQACVLWLQLAD